MRVGLEHSQDLPAEQIADLLRKQVKADSIAAGDAVWQYACAGTVPQCVVSPDCIEEVQAAVRVAAEHGLVMVPCANATHLYIGSSPVRYDVALSLRHLHRVIEHEPGDMTVTAEAGVSLRELNAILGRAGQMLPLDPPYGDLITLGGLIAADRNGPTRLAYGKVRDLLLGVKVVTADGEILKGGGRVVKNVAGYDLPKLFVGSLGTLGVLVEASFKLWPLPAKQILFLLPSLSVSEAVSQGLALLETGMTPTLLEALDPNAGEAVGIGSGALLIGCSGSDAEAEGFGTRLGELLPDFQIVEEREADALRKALAAFPQPMSEDALVARVSVLPSQLPSLLRRFEGEAETRGVTLEIAAHAGNGVAWCQFAGPVSLLDFELCAEAMRVQTRTLGGWLVVEAFPAGLQGRVDPWGFNQSTLPLMRRIKAILDPNGVFAPGRFVGGI